MAVWLDAVGIAAPGFPGWSHARRVFLGVEPYRPEPIPAPWTGLLRASERRRTTAVIRLALQAAEDALRGTHVNAEELCSVFASSSGDMETTHKICSALTLPERPVSPTQFHNSVHNAPAGYWSVGVAARMPSISIGAYDQTFEAALLEAWSMVEVEQQSVLLVAYEWPPPPPLHAHRPLDNAFATALLLTKTPRAASRLRIALRLESGTVSTMPDSKLEALRHTSPAAHCLPLLAAIATGECAEVRLPYPSFGVLKCSVSPNH